jgi:hypothetical protein
MMNRSQLRRVFAIFALTSILSLVPLVSADAAGLARWGRDEQSASSWIEARGSWIRGLLVNLLEKAGVQIDPEGNK